MKFRILFALSLCLALTNCGTSGSGDGASVTTQLLRLTSARRALRPSGDSRAVGVNSDITIASLKVPIRTISLSSGTSGSGSPIYDCPANSNDECLVDLAVGSNLQNLLTGASAKTVAEGTYDTISIATCKDEGKYTGKIKASGKTDPSGAGVVVYTQAASGALTNDVNLWGEATVFFSGCQRSYPLPTPVTVKKGDPALDVKLYFDIRDIAFFGDPTIVGGNEAWYSGGYSFEYPATPTGDYVGVNYLDVAGTVDAGTPTIERYRVTVGTGEIGTFGLLFTSTGTYIGGFTRSFYSAASTQGHNRFVTPIQVFTANADGTTFTLKNYGSTATGDGYFNTVLFARADTVAPVAFTDNTGAAAGTYTAIKLPD